LKVEDKIAALEEGIRLFNAGWFYECHEVWEEMWIEDRSEFRELYQGLIKLAVALYHGQMGNFLGARKVLESGLNQLRPYAGRETPVELEPVIEVLQGVLDSIRSGEARPIPHPKLVSHPDLRSVLSDGPSDAESGE
jgi:hypothetical protein